MRAAGGETENVAPQADEETAGADLTAVSAETEQSVTAASGDTPDTDDPAAAGGMPEPVSDTDRITHGEEAEALRRIYPSFDAEREMQDPMFRALALGEVRPTLRQVYELCHAAELSGAADEPSAPPAEEPAQTDAAVHAPATAAASEAGAAAIETAVAAAVASSVAAAVAEAEERLLAHIRARGYRPPENGLSASGGVRMHPAVDRLTRSDRERLAERASRGECITL